MVYSSPFLLLLNSPRTPYYNVRTCYVFCSQCLLLE